MKIIAVIPARYASTRFPAKLLQDLGGKTVILRTYEAAVSTNLFDDVFKVGATYKWDNDDTTPTPQGYAELKDKTDVLIDGSYEVLEHVVGIRPTTKDRRPILGKHEQEHNMYLFNGLGSKGVLIAPYFSKIMADFILNNTVIDNEISTNRF